MNKENLTKLLKALKSKKKLPCKFDMADYADYKNDTYCGTVGCLVGIASYIIRPKRFFEGWSDFGQRIFDIRCETDTYLFLFGGGWSTAKRTNTKTHAIKRIEYVLKHGKAPKNWNSNHDYSWGL